MLACTALLIENEMTLTQTLKSRPWFIAATRKLKLARRRCRLDGVSQAPRPRDERPAGGAGQNGDGIGAVGRAPQEAGADAAREHREAVELARGVVTRVGAGAQRLERLGDDGRRAWQRAGRGGRRRCGGGIADARAEEIAQLARRAEHALVLGRGCQQLHERCGRAEARGGGGGGERHVVDERAAQCAAHRGVAEARALLDEDVLQRRALAREQQVGHLLGRRALPRRVDLDGGGRVGVAREALRHLEELGGVQRASGRGRRRRRGRLAVGRGGGRHHDAVARRDDAARPALEAEHGAKRRLGARRAVGEEAAREVRVALLHDGVVLVDAEADALEGREGARDVEHVRRQLEELAVAAAHLFHDVAHARDVDALGLELRLHALHHFGLRRLLELFVAQLGAVALLELPLHALGDLGGPAARRELAEGEGDALRDARGLELLGGDALGREAQVDEVLRDLAVVLGVDVRDELEQRVLEVLRHVERHAPIEDAQPAVGGAQQVARVRVAVQHARVEQHRQVGVDRHAAQPRHVGRGVAVEARALHPLRDEHAVAHELRDDGGRADRVEPALLHVHREVDGVLGLEPVIGLGHEATAPFVDELQRHLDVRGIRREAVDHVGQPRLEGRGQAEHVQVERDLGEDAGALHLDRHRRAVAALERALVHLADGGRRDRRRRERAEDLAQVLDAELLAQYAEGLLRGEGRHGVLQLPQLERVGGGDEVLADGERLPELDEGGAELLAQHERLLGAARLGVLERGVLLVLEELAQHQPVKEQARREGRVEARERDDPPRHQERTLAVEGVGDLGVVRAGARLVRRLAVFPAVRREDEAAQPEGGDNAELQREARRRHLAEDRRVHDVGERGEHGRLHELGRVQSVERRRRHQPAGLLLHLAGQQAHAAPCPVGNGTAPLRPRLQGHQGSRQFHRSSRGRLLGRGHHRGHSWRCGRLERLQLINQCRLLLQQLEPSLQRGNVSIHHEGVHHHRPAPSYRCGGGGTAVRHGP
eukprot:scaffold22828_cov72-Phaeocystis_antarctica.AAC.2